MQTYVVILYIKTMNAEEYGTGLLVMFHSHKNLLSKRIMNTYIYNSFLARFFLFRPFLHLLDSLHLQWRVFQWEIRVTSFFSAWNCNFCRIWDDPYCIVRVWMCCTFICTKNYFLLSKCMNALFVQDKDGLNEFVIYLKPIHFW